jgi:hypothetical protein
MPGLIDRIFEPDFSFRDWPGSVPNWQSWLFRGGFYSSVTAASSQDRDFWFTGYVQAYLERDLRQISQIDQLPDFQKVMRFAALRTGRLINQSEIARDAAIPQPTCHRYLNLLEAGYQTSRLPVYAVNRTKSLIKAKKLFWNDCGLAAWLASLRSPDEIVKGRTWGSGSSRRCSRLFMPGSQWTQSGGKPIIGETIKGRRLILFSNRMIAS